MKTTKLIFISALAMFFCLATSSRAEDIDIYSNVGGTNNIPNVMLIVDSAANSDGNFGSGSCTYWDGSSPSLSGSQVLGNEQCAMANIVHSFPTNNGVALINVGITTANGFLIGLTPIDDKTNASGFTNRQTIINAIQTGYSKRTGFTVMGQELQETWAYYTGGNKGANGTQNNVGSISSSTFSTGAGVASTGCQKNYIITIGASPSSAHTKSPSDDGAAPLDLLTAINNDKVNTIITSNIATTLSTQFAGNTENPWAIEWARYMNQVDRNSSGTGTKNIVTYSVDLLGSPGNSNMQTFWANVALYGGGKAFTASVYSDIYNSLLKILNEVQAVNSVFSSSTLPVSVNTQGTYLNQVFMGMFRPDANGLPRWVGNLKQYQFLYNSTTQSLSLGDSTGAAAINSAGTGFISPNAISFWTSKDTSKAPDSTGGFWVNAPSSAGGGYDSPDGEVVEKGGAAQQIRLANLTDDYTTTAGTSTNPRKLYTYCPSGSSCVNNLSDTTNVFNTSNTAITDAMLGTGNRTISSITSAATITPTSTVAVNYPPGISTTPASVSITNFSKSSSTVTATLSASDFALISPSSQVTVTGAGSKVNCTACTITSTNSANNTFTYTVSGGSGSLPSSASATISNPYNGVSYSVVTVNGSNPFFTSPSSFSSVPTITFASASNTAPCTILTALNNTIQTVTSITSSSFTITVSPSTLSGTDTNCQYSPNTATVSSPAHGFPAGATVTIAGAGGSTTMPYTGYNGLWPVNVTGTDTFTYQYTANAPLANFTSTGATAYSTSSSRDLLIKWVRGQDNAGDEAGPGGTVTVRPSIHGDVLHSRPIVINYGGTMGIIAFYGANDGVFRAINGNQTSNPTGSTLSAPGSELWSFIPTEFYGKLNRLRTNSPQLSLPSTPSGIIPTPQKKDYFIDGPTGIYQVINSSGVTTSANIYLSMRRGGRFIYALQVNDPTNPQLLWKASNTSTDFAELGQTWSEPKVAFVKGYADGSGNLKPVLIFGAGYDPKEDNEPPTADTMGRGIFIVDAATGAMIWSARHDCTGVVSTCVTPTGMDYAISSDITLVDKNADGAIDRLYATDLGGNVWRVDLEKSTTQNTPAYWQVEKLAALGCDTGVCTSGTTPRKFFYKADVVPTGTFDAVLVASGDREHPLAVNAANNVTNRVYMLKDTATGNDGSGLTTITQNATSPAGLFNATDTSGAINATTNKCKTSVAWDGTRQGYFITLQGLQIANQNGVQTCVVSSGEKVVNAPSTAAGSTFFGSNQPVTSSNSCGPNLGMARGYTLNPLTGTTSYIVFSGGGLPPTPVYGFVNITVTNANGTTGTKLVPFVIGAGNTDPTCTGPDCTSSIGSIKPNINISTSRNRTYWYIEKDQ